MERNLALYLSELEAIWLCRLLGSLNCEGESTQPLEVIYTQLADKIEIRGLIEKAYDLPSLPFKIVNKSFNGSELIRFEGMYHDS